MPKEEILEVALWAEKQGYGSIMLQSGEINTSMRVQFILDVLKAIKAKTTLGISLCLGEFSREVYQQFFDAGAHRYLLRIETSNPKLYRKIHPGDHSFERRLQCLHDLREIGFQTGTGVMIGLPFQSIEDLADDLLFFKEIDIDMIGMGPYILHKETPLAKQPCLYSKEKRLFLSIKMVALARLLLQDVNIAATTAMQTLHPKGREMALKSGANILMPIITPNAYRFKYLIYEGKPCIDESAEECQRCLERRLKSIDREVGLHLWGDSPHYFARSM
jgi:biotin synthase